MIRFDRIKFKTHINNVKSFDAFKFTCSEHDGRIKMATLHSDGDTKLPFDLQVKINFTLDEVIIDLPAKILMNMYFEKLNLNTIRYGINLLWSEHGLIDLDIEKTLADAEVLASDVAYDIEGLSLNELDIKTLAISTNSKKWMPNEYRHGIVFTSTGKNKATSLCLYNKNQEMLLSRNRIFLEEANLSEILELNEYLRIEAKFQSKESMRKAFNITSTGLSTMLICDATPLSDTFRRIIDVAKIEQQPNSELDKLNAGEFKNYLLVKEARFDLMKLTKLIDKYYKKNTNKRSTIRRYKKYLDLGSGNDTSVAKRIVNELSLFGM